jgi:hypothetical protein
MTRVGLMIAGRSRHRSDVAGILIPSAFSRERSGQIVPGRLDQFPAL